MDKKLIKLDRVETEEYKYFINLKLFFLISNIDIIIIVVSNNEIEIYSNEENSKEIYFEDSYDSDDSDASDDFYKENYIKKIQMFKIIPRGNQKNISFFKIKALQVSS